METVRHEMVLQGFDPKPAGVYVVPEGKVPNHYKNSGHVIGWCYGELETHLFFAIIYHLLCYLWHLAS